MAVQGITSTRYESWVTNLKAVQGLVRRRIFGAFASVLGDKSVEWMTQANLEHLPSFASDQGVALIASERQMDTATGETVRSIAARAPYWLQLARFSGSGLGVLLGLHFSGFDGAVLVQQNGIALSLTLPLPPFVLGQAWDPTPNLVTTACSPLATALTSSVTPTRSIPAGTPWFFFDSNTDFCSRFAVIFPSPLSSAFTRVTGRATFNASASASMAWSATLSSNSYYPMIGMPVVTDGGASVVVAADSTSQTTTAITVNADAAFSGYVDGVAVGALSTSDLQRMQSTLIRWKPAKATCVGVYAVASGQMVGYPVRLIGSGGTVGPSSVQTVLGSF